MAAVLVALIAVLDGAFAGFRAGAGRDGRVRHLRADLRNQLVGAMLVAVLLVPPALVILRAPESWFPAAERLAWVLGPYAALVLSALAVYLLLPWRARFLAIALVLGPLTLLRPVVAAAGLTLAVAVGPAPLNWLVAAWGLGLVVFIEPMLGWALTRQFPWRSGR